MSDLQNNIKNRPATDPSPTWHNILIEHAQKVKTRFLRMPKPIRYASSGVGLLFLLFLIALVLDSNPKRSNSSSNFGDQIEFGNYGTNWHNGNSYGHGFENVYGNGYGYRQGRDYGARSNLGLFSNGDLYVNENDWQTGRIYGSNGTIDRTGGNNSVFSTGSEVIYLPF